MNTRQHNEHGVFLSVFNVGLLISGKPGIGKSTLALELIERGHSLVSDDVVYFETRSNYNNSGQSRLIGKSPDILKDFLAVRDLGVINITQIFPATHSIPELPLDLIVKLVDENTRLATTLTGISSGTSILNQTIPTQFIYAHPKRNLALIVETAVKNYILLTQDESAAKLLDKRQKEIMTKAL